jgi:hypothetical protein
VRDDPARLVPFLEALPKGGDVHNHLHIRDAVNVAGAQRIGHGVDLIYEKGLAGAPARPAPARRGDRDQPRLE